jgi:hypothetical protein
MFRIGRLREFTIAQNDAGSSGESGASRELNYEAAKSTTTASVLIFLRTFTQITQIVCDT